MIRPRQKQPKHNQIHHKTDYKKIQTTYLQRTMKIIMIFLGYFMTINIANGQKVDFSNDLIDLLENPKSSKDLLMPENFIDKL